MQVAFTLSLLFCSIPSECSSWEYDRSDVEETVATSFDWVCGKELRSVHMLSIGSIGSSIGTLLLPYFADR